MTQELSVPEEQVPPEKELPIHPEIEYDENGAIRLFSRPPEEENKSHLRYDTDLYESTLKASFVNEVNDFNDFNEVNEVNKAAREARPRSCSIEFTTKDGQPWFLNRTQVEKLIQEFGEEDLYVALCQARFWQKTRPKSRRPASHQVHYLKNWLRRWHKPDNRQPPWMIRSKHAARSRYGGEY